MTVDLDATDQLEAGDPLAAVTGIAPQLSALEMLLYPSTSLVIANAALLLAGTIEILPPEAPLTVLVWGPGRVVPVRVDSLTSPSRRSSPASSRSGRSVASPRPFSPTTTSPSPTPASPSSSCTRC